MLAVVIPELLLFLEYRIWQPVRWCIQAECGTARLGTPCSQVVSVAACACTVRGLGNAAAIPSSTVSMHFKCSALPSGNPVIAFVKMGLLLLCHSSSIGSTVTVVTATSTQHLGNTMVAWIKRSTRG